MSARWRGGDRHFRFPGCSAAQIQAEQVSDKVHLGALEVDVDDRVDRDPGFGPRLLRNGGIDVSDGDLDLGDAVASRDGELGASAVLLRAGEVVIDGDADPGDGVPGSGVRHADPQPSNEERLVVVVLPDAHGDPDATGSTRLPAWGVVCGRCGRGEGDGSQVALVGAKSPDPDISLIE